MCVLPTVKSGLWKALTLVFPPASYWKTLAEMDHGSTIEEYEREAKEAIEDYRGDLEHIEEDIKGAHQTEIERSATLDSKAGNYFGNLGVVLSILSIGPIIAVVLGIGQPEFSTASWHKIIIVIAFGYAGVALLLSAYYSFKALKMKGYSVYYTADAMQERISNNSTSYDKRVEELLVCKKNNELNNLNKNNVISVSESLSRNGLISLGIGIFLIAVLLVPTPV